MYGLNPLPRGNVPAGYSLNPRSVVQDVGYHLAPFRRMQDSAALNGFQGIVVLQTEIGDQIDVQMDGFQGIVVLHTFIPDQIDIQLDGFQGGTLLQREIGDQIDIQMDGFQGGVLLQRAYP